jgi:ribonuclease HI
MSLSKKEIVNIDGACSNNGQPNAVAGYGVYWGEDHPLNASNALPQNQPQTNNRAEMMAAIEAINIAVSCECEELLVRTDSNYLIKGINEWMVNWKKNGWLTAGGKPVLNQDLWERLDSQVSSNIKIKWQHVSAHSGDKPNEEADKLAKAAVGREDQKDQKEKTCENDKPTPTLMQPKNSDGRSTTDIAIRKCDTASQTDKTPVMNTCESETQTDVIPETSVKKTSECDSQTDNAKEQTTETQTVLMGVEIELIKDIKLFASTIQNLETRITDNINAAHSEKIQAEFQATQKESEALKSKIVDLKDDLAEQKKENEHLKHKLENVQTTLRTKEQDIITYKAAQRVPIDNERKIKELNKDKDELLRQLKEYKIKEKDLQQEIREMEKKMDKYEEDRIENRQKYANLQEKCEDIQRRLLEVQGVGGER